MRWPGAGILTGEEEGAMKKITSLIICITVISPNIANARETFAPPRVRYNINSLTSSEITALENGVQTMKNYPATDKRNWNWQANIHQAMSGSDPLWSQCEHGTQFFLAWHRMYLYYFERILRNASGSSTLTLPYWNYSDVGARQIPAPFRVSTSPLFDSSRGPGRNAGTSFLPNSSVDITNLMTVTPFMSFQSSLEGVPHGAVHVWVGGNMTTFAGAARDPIFWLIDFGVSGYGADAVAQIRATRPGSTRPTALWTRTRTR